MRPPTHLVTAQVNPPGPSRSWCPRKPAHGGAIRHRARVRARARARLRRKLRVSGLHRPTSMESTTRRHRWERNSSGQVRSFLRRASRRAAPPASTRLTAALRWGRAISSNAGVEPPGTLLKGGGTSGTHAVFLEASVLTCSSALQGAGTRRATAATKLPSLQAHGCAGAGRHACCSAAFCQLSPLVSRSFPCAWGVSACVLLLLQPPPLTGSIAILMAVCRLLASCLQTAVPGPPSASRCPAR